MKLRRARQCSPMILRRTNISWVQLNIVSMCRTPANCGTTTLPKLSVRCFQESPIPDWMPSSVLDGCRCMPWFWENQILWSLPRPAYLYHITNGIPWWMFLIPGWRCCLSYFNGTMERDRIMFITLWSGTLWKTGLRSSTGTCWRAKLNEFRQWKLWHNNAALWREIGEWLHMKEKCEEAVLVYKKLLQITPESIHTSLIPSIAHEMSCPLDRWYE